MKIGTILILSIFLSEFKVPKNDGEKFFNLSKSSKTKIIFKSEFSSSLFNIFLSAEEIRRGSEDEIFFSISS